MSLTLQAWWETFNVFLNRSILEQWRQTSSLSGVVQLTRQEKHGLLSNVSSWTQFRFAVLFQTHVPVPVLILLRLVRVVVVLLQFFHKVTFISDRGLWRKHTSVNSWRQVWNWVFMTMAITLMIYNLHRYSPNRTKSLRCSLPGSVRSQFLEWPQRLCPQPWSLTRLKWKRERKQDDTCFLTGKRNVSSVKSESVWSIHSATLSWIKTSMYIFGTWPFIPHPGSSPSYWSQSNFTDVPWGLISLSLGWSTSGKTESHLDCTAPCVGLEAHSHIKWSSLLYQIENCVFSPLSQTYEAVSLHIDRV